MLGRLLEFCQPEHPHRTLQGALEGIRDIVSQLPLALGCRFADSLQSLVVNDAIQQEQIQIKHLRQVAQLSKVNTQASGQVEQLQSRIKGLQNIKDENMDSIKKDLSKMQEQLAPHLEEMEKLRSQEIMEQAAISRNLSEFNKLQEYCGGSMIDARAHQRVQETMININYYKILVKNTVLLFSFVFSVHVSS